MEIKETKKSQNNFEKKKKKENKVEGPDTRIYKANQDSMV